MIYSKHGAEVIKERLVSKSQRYSRKLFISLFKVVLVAFVFIIVVAAGAGFGMMKGILDKFSYTYDADENLVKTISEYLPVTPYSDVFKKMKDSSTSYMTTFYNRLSKAVNNLTDAVNVESAHDAAGYVQKVLGDRFTIPPKEAVAATAQNKREHSFG